MTPPRRQKSNLHRSTPEPEHGDWRVQLNNAEEVEHMRAHSFRNMLHRARVVAQTWQDMEPEIVPIQGWPRIKRLLISLFLLLPLCVVMVLALGLQIYHHAGAVIDDRNFWLSVPVWYTLMGCTLFAALILSKLMEDGLVYVYVLGHELTHALATLICFGKVSSLKIDAQGGYVETSKDNVFIALAPYFIPFWMMCWMLLVALYNCAFPFEEFTAWFCAGFGFWWFFHLYWTIWVIPREQPDMLEKGLLFSLLLVTTINILFLLVVLWIFDLITPIGYANDFVDAAWRIFSLFRELPGLL